MGDTASDQPVDEPRVEADAGLAYRPDPVGTIRDQEIENR